MQPPLTGLKARVYEYWNRACVETQFAGSLKYSREYFDEIEYFRYRDQHFIHAFAQFTRYHGKRVIEVGFGAGTDFIQWMRAGAQVTGIDLVEEAYNTLKHRIQAYGLPEPEHYSMADGEDLPFENDQFDLGYSYGVLHHIPDTERALSELVRVVKPGGELKVMFHNLHSVLAFRCWLKNAALRGKPWKSFRWTIQNYIESPGTDAYSRREVLRMLSKHPLKNVHIRTEVTNADYLAYRKLPPLNLLVRALLRLAGGRERWRPEDYKPGAAATGLREMRSRPEYSGNPLGWFHCVSAVKTG